MQNEQNEDTESQWPGWNGEKWLKNCQYLNINEGKKVKFVYDLCISLACKTSNCYTRVGGDKNMSLKIVIKSLYGYHKTFFSTCLGIIYQK